MSVLPIAQQQTAQCIRSVVRQEQKERIVALGLFRNELHRVFGPQIGRVFWFDADLSVFDHVSTVKRTRSPVRHRDPVVVEAFLRSQVSTEMPFANQATFVTGGPENFWQGSEFIQGVACFGASL